MLRLKSQENSNRVVEWLRSGACADKGMQDHEGRCVMISKTKTLTALAVAATLAVAGVAAPQPAEARGGAIAAGIIGGIAAGAIIGSAANGYYGGPGYYYGAPAPAYYGGGCYWHRERFWDGWGWRVRRVQVCD